MEDQVRITTFAVYGWEADGQYWHGPTELPGNHKRRCGALNPSLGLCISRKNSRMPDGLPVALTTTIRDVGDCAVVTIDIDTGDSGPLAILAVLPADRRPAVRPEFAFELTSFVRFLEGPCAAGSELAIHDRIQEVLETDKEGSIVFAINSASCAGDLGIAVSGYIEQISTSVLEWMSERDTSTPPACRIADAAHAGAGRDGTRPNY